MWSAEEHREWYTQLPQFYGSACLLVTDPGGRVLLVKPNYRDHWSIPGGIIEADESPHECCAREIKEELGIDIPIGPLLTVDWARAEGLRPKAMVNFLFDGGVLEDFADIKLQESELDDLTLIDPGEANVYLPPNVAPRIPAGLQARANRTTEYLADTQPHRPNRN